MELNQLLKGITDKEIANIYINGIQNDSRKVMSGDLFIAYQGNQVHGIEFVKQAKCNGASAMLYDEQCALQSDENLPAIQINHLRDQLGQIASRFYQNPSANIPVIAITGTDGKTSVANFVVQALNLSGKQCGLLGTLGNGLLNALEPTLNTTPDSLFIQRFTCDLIDKGGDCLVLEASSHGIDQGRLNGLMVDVAVFTNISLEHSDYHRSFESYLNTKCELFKHPTLSYAVINSDSEYCDQVVSVCPSNVEIIKYSMHDSTADISLNSLTVDCDGIDMNVNALGEQMHIKTKAIGRINAENILATLAVMYSQNVDMAVAPAYLTQLQAVCGRMELFKSPNGAIIILDYAHTPNALEKLLLECRNYCKAHLICVFGCGGDRDQKKRFAMGNVADRITDQIILTDDNPRTENSEKIIQDIQCGIKHLDKVKIINDRKKAIEQAVKYSSADDVVVIAGKGHETHQVIGDEQIHFNDKEVILSAIENIS